MFSVFVYRIVCCACLCVCRHLWWNPTKYEQNLRKGHQHEREREMSQFGRRNGTNGWVKKPPVKPKTWHYITLSYHVVCIHFGAYFMCWTNKYIESTEINCPTLLPLALWSASNFDMQFLFPIVDSYTMTALSLYHILDTLFVPKSFDFFRKKDRHTIQCYVTSMIAHEKRIFEMEKNAAPFHLHRTHLLRIDVNSLTILKRISHYMFLKSTLLHIIAPLNWHFYAANGFAIPSLLIDLHQWRYKKTTTAVTENTATTTMEKNSNDREKNPDCWAHKAVFRGFGLGKSRVHFQIKCNHM